LVVERPDNGAEHAYALVPGRLGLAARDDRLVADPAGPAEVFWKDDRLWLRSGDDPAAPLVAGSVVEVGGLAVHVRPIASNAALE
jgi:hypothetical protein